MSKYKQNFDGIAWESDPDAPLPRRSRPRASSFPMPAIASDYEAYDCPITGKTIDGRREHEANLAKHGCRILEPGEHEQTKKIGRSRINAEMDAAIDKAADAVAHEFDL